MHPVQAHDHIALTEARPGCGAVRRDAGHKRTLFVVKAEARRDIGRDALNFDAEETAVDMTLAPKLLDDGMNGRSRYRKANAHAPAARRVDGCVHADDPAGYVESRSTGIAAIDGSIDLDVIRVRTASDIAAHRRNNS